MATDNARVGRVFTFDKVFGQHSSQREVYDSLQVGYLVKRVIEVSI